MAILQSLRQSPAAIVKTNGIRSQPAGGSFAGVQQGGRCQITETSSDRTFTLTATENSGTDYFYPWLQRSYGWVRVPKSVHDGVIVATGGLNGCSLIVSESGTDLYFYHDGDSKYLPLGSTAIQGNEIVRIKPDDYDSGDVVHKSFTATLESYRDRKMPIPSGDLSYGIYIFWVKVNGEFIAVSSSIISVGTPISLPGAEITRFTP
ncbi:hypothetical protein LOC67_09440 [Stieleria sp. JC731]|uniref:hypothetical protein n=1 Tax=Pirellulaceae TaxID=2691357 RepID=UPI001E5F57AA|nr:hypothetical protein [Stieleria sp. JC731]MCC9600787.1 hypothetical protein [Stieleria sp. JC731]